MLTAVAPSVKITPTPNATSDRIVPTNGPAAATSKYCLRFLGKESRGVIAPNNPSCDATKITIIY